MGKSIRKIGCDIYIPMEPKSIEQALSVGYWVLGTGYWVLGIGYWFKGIGFIFCNSNRDEI